MVKVLGDAAYLRLSRRALHEPWRHTLVDLEDYERLSATKWRAERSGKSFYAVATSLQRLAKHHMRLHQYVLRTDPGQIVDHINGDTLDNRKQNLRICTASENAKNKLRQTSPGKTSRFKGVSWSKYDGRWAASIRSDFEVTALGLFDTEEQAGLAYDAAARTIHGEFARTNADMKLYEMADPFVPDCSKAEVFDRKDNDLTKHRPPRNLSPRNYQQRLDDKLRKEIAAHHASAR